MIGLHVSWVCIIYFELLAAIEMTISFDGSLAYYVWRGYAKFGLFLSGKGVQFPFPEQLS